MSATTEARPKSPLADGFRLAHLTVEPRDGALSGPGGVQRLDPKVMGVLVALAERAGHVVSRDELLARVWPNVVVSDDALSRCLHELRRQLALAGGRDDDRALVETLPKRGYRLKADVQALPPPAPAAAGRRISRWVWAGVAIASFAALAGAFLLRDRALTDPQASVAVIPFADMSPGKDQGWFADGVAEEILNHLSQSRDLRVIGRTSSFTMRDANLDVREIARRLGVTHVLEGSVRKDGHEIRITAQLISGRDGSHVWSHTFEKRQGDLFAIQDEIAVGVATALDVALVPRPPGAAAPSPEGYGSFLRGEQFYWRRGPGDLERARAAYEAAIASDPGYARAWAALAGVYSIKAWETIPPAPSMLERQRDAAAKAVELEPDLAVGHLRLAQYYAETGQPDRKRRHKAIAEQLEPSHPLVLSWAADDDIERGDFDGAIDKLEQTVAREPLLPIYRVNLAVVLAAAGRLDRALTEYRRVRDLNPSGQLGVELDIVRVLVLQKRHAEAASELASVPEGKRRDYGYAILLDAPGQRARSDAALERLRQDPDDGASQEEVNDTIQLAEAEAVRGNFDAAFKVLADRLAGYEKLPYPTFCWYLRHEARLSPFLKPLQADPRWAAFILEKEPSRS